MRWVFLCLLLIASTAEGQYISRRSSAAVTSVVFDTAKAAYTASTTTRALSITLGAAANTGTLVWVDTWHSGGTPLDSVTAGSGVKGTSLARLKEDGSGIDSMYLYGFVGLSSGAHTFTVYAHSSSTDIAMGIMSFTGVNQSTPWGTVATQVYTSSQTHPTLAVTGATGAIPAACIEYYNLTVTDSSAQTQKFNANGGSDVNTVVGSIGTTGASQTFEWTLSSTGYKAVCIGVAVKP